MKKANSIDTYFTLLALNRLGGIAMSSLITKEVKSLGYNDSKVRNALRKLERDKVIKSDRPLPESLELRWEFVKKV